jgi:hypothetical protein
VGSRKVLLYSGLFALGLGGNAYSQDSSGLVLFDVPGAIATYPVAISAPRTSWDLISASQNRPKDSSATRHRRLHGGDGFVRQPSGEIELFSAPPGADCQNLSGMGINSAGVLT